MASTHMTLLQKRSLVEGAGSQRYHWELSISKHLSLLPLCQTRFQKPWMFPCTNNGTTSMQTESSHSFVRDACPMRMRMKFFRKFGCGYGVLEAASMEAM